MKHNIVGLLLVTLTITELVCSQTSFYQQYCTRQSTIEYTVAYPPNYQQFVVCNPATGTARVDICAAGKLYDNRLDICLPNNVAVVAYPNVLSAPAYMNEYCTTLENGQTLPALECDKYYVCNTNVAYELTCPTGQHYSRAYTACMTPLKAGCKTLATMCLDQYNGYQFAALQCESYYVCNANLVPVLNNCSSGLYYNSLAQSCVLPQFSNCVPEATTLAPRPSSPSFTTLPTTLATDSCGIPICTPNNNGAFAKHAKCNWFYMCLNSTAVEMKCECGLYYNSLLKYCVKNTNNVCQASE